MNICLEDGLVNKTIEGWNMRKNLLADEGAVIFAGDGVEELLRIPVGAHRVPEVRAHDVDAVLLVHDFVVSVDGEVSSGRSWFRVGEEDLANSLSVTVVPGSD